MSVVLRKGSYLGQQCKQLIIRYKSITILVNTFECLEDRVLIQGFFLPHYVTKIIVRNTICSEDINSKHHDHITLIR